MGWRQSGQISQNGTSTKSRLCISGWGRAQGLVLADDVVHCDEVEIDQPRPPARGLLAPVPPELGLDAMQPGQDRRRGQDRAQEDAAVEELGIGLGRVVGMDHRRRFQPGGARHDLAELGRHQGHGLLKRGAAVAEIGAERHDGAAGGEGGAGMARGLASIHPLAIAAAQSWRPQRTMRSTSLRQSPRSRSM